MAYIIGSHGVLTLRRTGHLYFTFVSILDGWWKDWQYSSLSGVRIERGKEALRGGASANHSFGVRLRGESANKIDSLTTKSAS